ncbi:MAG: type II secretion system protein [Kiritimatiellia bacterium]
MNLIYGKMKARRAFTLMELMIVLLIIGILMSGVFMLMSIASRQSDKAATRAKIQKVQNAISGFYAAYGTYPPVDNKYVETMDPFTNFKDDFDQDVEGSGDLNARACRWVSRAQPVSFEYPCALEMDRVINRVYGSMGTLSPNNAFPNPGTTAESDWEEVKMFKFGLMSFLLPRIAMVGNPAESGFNDEQPNPGFYESAQWKAHNRKFKTGYDGSNLAKAMRTQSAMENRAVSKWLPNLDSLLAQLEKSIMNVSLRDSYVDMNDIDLDPFVTGAMENSSDVDLHDMPYRGPYKSKSGQKTMLVCATVKDSWDMDLFYYSAPPYQSYRLWSAGPDQKTFPPWIPLESLSSSDRAIVSEWLEDDIVGLD